ncbi:TolC family protein [Rhodobacteraceae bacterium NNCM2]|nr:TolC family protein [Coraliihabitans acroporae]
MPLTAALLSAGLLGCSEGKPPGPSPTPAAPWGLQGSTSGDFSVPAQPAAVEIAPGIQSEKFYDLPELIDLAQRLHPSTKVAWERARQAAIAAGMIEATYLPVITANVIAGRQEIVTPVPTLTGGTDYVDTVGSGVAPYLALQWLLFDFGQRDAWSDAAEQAIYAANVTFNGTHQALIFNVSRAYYLYGAALEDQKYAKQALVNSHRLRDAAQARYNNGLGTTIEVAQAKQLVAQAKLRLVVAQDVVRDTYQELLAAVGIPPSSKIKVTSAANRPLPPSSPIPTEQVIKAALARRPDVLASYAALKASEADAAAAEAEFMPKIYFSGILGTNQNNLQTANLPQIGGQAMAWGVLLGVTIPLYDGGLREARQYSAESKIAEAEAALEQIRQGATREIILAADALRSALETHAAATELANAARITFDAAFDAYQNGIGTITDSTAAETALIDAREAKTDAHAAALVAASTLAFALGNMTSKNAPAQALNTEVLESE